ncbi:PEP/pyruvate-binding domain-containing protein [Desulfococcus sp.]|uniref:PEP/pyruvate-binding domain-containing protein n=1 Tax=Desulfococcus sp. TaxID=2025834 RepID=UPI0035938B90
MFNQLQGFFKKFAKRPPAQGEIMTHFRRKYAAFKILLESNADLLKTISGMEEKLAGRQVFGMSYIRSETARIIFHAMRMVKSFEVLIGRPCPALMETVDRIQWIINQELELKKTPRIPDRVLPFTRITRDMVDFIGGKNANLGEIKSRTRLLIPRGFAITTTAFDELIEFNDLMDEIRRQKMELDPRDPESVLRISQTIRRLFLESRIPKALENEILKAYSEEICPDGTAFVALRSSAVGEDSERSFAGQYQSFLNVPKDQILQKYKAVVASLFTPRAISYRLRMGISFEDEAMSVTCLEMVAAKASGVMYTRHPIETWKDEVIINAVWGLGTSVVDGTATPDSYTLSKSAQPALLSSSIAAKSTCMVSKSDGGISETAVEDEIHRKPCLTDAQAVTLASCGMALEKHFQGPQDVEWSLDHDGKIIILQTRPLLMKEREGGPMATPMFSDYPVLLEEGVAACPGVGWGPAHIIRSDEDLLSFPDGGVLVAAHSSPQYVMVMDKAQAIVTNAGSVTGHMASLAREFKVPAILNTQRATQVIRQGETVTVDAFGGRVYAGKVEALLNIQWPRAAYMRDTPVCQTLEKLSRYIIPLNLTNPKSRRFTAKNCETIHDVMRYAHEMSYAELFQLGDFTADHGKIAVRLDVPLPIDLHIIDLGGGLLLSEKSVRIKPAQVVSTPFKAVLEGMLHSELKPLEPRPINVRGFLSVLSEQMIRPPRPEHERFGDRSYAILSDKYLNFSSRVGYHYSILDTYCGKSAMLNYINFQFKGGAADDLRRNRRARLIRNILEVNGFLVEVQGDRVNARFAKQPQAVIAERLEMLGRLLIFTRQMDMLMENETMLERLTESFLSGRYDVSEIYGN